jgi:hypothetical protein
MTAEVALSEGNSLNTGYVRECRTEPDANRIQDTGLSGTVGPNEERQAISQGHLKRFDRPKIVDGNLLQLHDVGLGLFMRSAISATEASSRNSSTASP